MHQTAKVTLCSFLVRLGTDKLLRYIHKKKLLVVAYHGVTTSTYDPPIWTQLPVNTFRRQIEFLAKNYHILSLSELTCYIDNCKPIPDGCALITLDDGLKNNYTVAYPVLKEFNVPATMFLVVDYVNTEKYFWFDELLFLLKNLNFKNSKLKNLFRDMKLDIVASDLWKQYWRLVEYLKKLPKKERVHILDRFRIESDADMNSVSHDFGMLSWHQVQEMLESGLIEFGVHSASHEILSTLRPTEFSAEILQPQAKLSRKLNRNIVSFCYPNGRPHEDYHAGHIRYLRKCGYHCAFTLKASLNSQIWQHSFEIARMTVGNDFSSHNDYFRLKTSGLFDLVDVYHLK